jgi:hypothetical protein
MANLTKAEMRTRTMLSNLIDLQHPVALAVEPLRATVLDRAKKDAAGQVEYVRAELVAADGDIQKCAPFPDGRMPGYKYHAARNRYNLFHAVTVTRTGTYTIRPNDPHFVDMDAKRIAKFIADAAERAAIDYDAFIVKLCGKIGACDAATISGDHVWGYSRLTVTKAGTVEIWQTKQIINTSKLGRLYNQWPSRKVKK